MWLVLLHSRLLDLLHPFEHLVGQAASPFAGMLYILPSVDDGVELGRLVEMPVGRLHVVGVAVCIDGS